MCMWIIHGNAKLRAIEEDDFELLYFMINNPDMEHASGGFNYPVSKEQQREWMRNYRCTDKDIKLMIELVNGKTIGVVMLQDIDWKNRKAEIGYKSFARPEDRMKGDMADAVSGILKYAFDELGMNCIYLEISEDNASSLRLAKKLKFQQEGIVRERAYSQGRFKNKVILSMLKSEYEAYRS